MRVPNILIAALSALLLSGLTVQAAERKFRAHLEGDQEVPAVSTRAQGQVQFEVSRDGTYIYYRLNVANIRNITQAHIHLGAKGVNGPIVAWLFPSAPPEVLVPGRFQGVLSVGVVTQVNLVGPLAGQMLSDLVDAMQTGNAYVNVHTQDVPSGEIRGQIR
jgi:(2Fe-2S) ferredoxin